MTRRAFGTAAAVVAGTVAMDAAAAARPDGRLVIDEGGFVDIGGVPQWIGVRGYGAKNPVMLFLTGGPGLGITHGAPVFDDWERTFTVAYWDMPHGGATHARNLGGDEGPLTEARFVDDAVAVAEHVRRRMGVRKIVLFGISFGSRVGMELIHRRPDLFSAYVGTAQVVSGPRGSRMGFDMALERARARGDVAAVAALEKAGPPPYRSMQHFLTRMAFTNPPGLPASPRETAANAAMADLVRRTPPRSGPSIPAGLPAFDIGANFIRVQTAMYQQASAWESAPLGRRFKVPVFVFQGDNDLNTPFPLAREWVAGLQAPAKAFELLPGASHNTIAFHADLLAGMRRHVLPAIRA